MKQLTKEEILHKCVDDIYIIPAVVPDEDVNKLREGIYKAMQSFSDQENARLTAINAKQRELITYLEKKMQWWSMTDDYRWLCNELASLQSVKEADNCIRFSEDQGRNHCCTDKVPGNKCIGTNCGHYGTKK